MQSLSYFSISSQLLMEEAEKLGIHVEPLAKEKNLFLYSYKGKTVVFKSVNFGENSLVGSKIADDKELTYIVLNKLGYPIAPSVYVQRSDFGEEFLDDITLPSFPLIIKPLDEAHGE